MDIYGPSDQDTIYYTVYKTTNLVNGKIYIGAHKTTDPWDKYLGSGHAFGVAIQKYGKSNFTKEVLAVFDNPEDMWATEARLVTADFINGPGNYNRKEGGLGGPLCTESRAKGGRKLRQVLKGKIKSELHRQRLAEALKGQSHTPERRANQSAGQKRRFAKSGGIPPETQAKITAWRTGKICINDGTQTKRIPADTEIPAGWVRGMHVKGAGTMGRYANR